MIVGLWEALRGFSRHRGLFLAAGLAFYFLICLIPMVFLVVSIAGFALKGPAAQAAVIGQLRQFLPVYQKELTEGLERIIATRRASGLAGTAILLFFSTQLFGALRMIMNDVFGVRKGRGAFKGLLLDAIMSLVMGVLFLVSIGVTDLFFVVKRFVLTPAHMPPAWIRWLFLGVGVTFNAVLFAVTYRYFPGRKVTLRAVLAGAVLATVLLEAAKQLFRWYIVSVGVYDHFYGPLGALVGLAMFVYYSGIVVILGAEYAAAVDARARSRR